MDDGEGAHGLDEEAARRLIAHWMATATLDVTDAGPQGGVTAGLEVPPADAHAVIVTARRLALQGLSAEPSPVPSPRLRLLAQALVVDQHPSAHTWNERERARLAKWVAVLLQRFGEDGVQRLTAVLACGQGPSGHCCGVSQ